MKKRGQVTIFMILGIFVLITVFSFVFLNNYTKTKQGYSKSPNISFDHAIMEKTSKAVVMPCDFQWSDVGNLNVFLETKERFETNKKTNIFNIDSKNNIVHSSHKTVTFVDLENICLIETEDSIVIANRNSTEKIKNIQQLLKENKLEHLL